MKKPKLHTFHVWVEQVNTQRLEVRARSGDEAVQKAVRKWKRENQPRIDYAEVIDVDDQPQQVWPPPRGS